MPLRCTIVTLLEEVKAGPGDYQHFVEVLWSLSDKRQQLLAALFSFLLLTHVKNLAKRARGTSKFWKTLQLSTVLLIAKNEGTWVRLCERETFSALCVKDIFTPSEGNIFPKNTERSENKMFIEENLWKFSSSRININHCCLIFRGCLCLL